MYEIVFIMINESNQLFTDASCIIFIFYSYHIQEKSKDLILFLMLFVSFHSFFEMKQNTNSHSDIETEQKI